MRLTHIGLLIAAIAFTTALDCAHIRPIIDASKYCVTESATDAAKDVIPTVNNVLGCSIADSAAIPACIVSGLEQLATRYGQDLLNCALSQIAGAKTLGPEDGIKQRRAREYLQSQRVSMMQGGGLAPRGLHTPEKSVRFRPLQPTRTGVARMFPQGVVPGRRFG